MWATLSRILAPLAFLAFGGFLFNHSWRDSAAHQAMREHGTRVAAVISDTTVTYNKQGTPSYSITLQWASRSGEPLSFGPTHVSPAFFRASGLREGLQNITTDILYLDEDPSQRPVIVADEAERTYQDTFGTYAGLISLGLGVLIGLFWPLLQQVTRIVRRSA
jgi:hypothetical protein